MSFDMMCSSDLSLSNSSSCSNNCSGDRLLFKLALINNYMEMINTVATYSHHHNNNHYGTNEVNFKLQSTTCYKNMVSAMSSLQTINNDINDGHDNSCHENLVSNIKGLMLNSQTQNIAIARAA